MAIEKLAVMASSAISSKLHLPAAATSPSLPTIRRLLHLLSRLLLLIVPALRLLLLLLLSPAQTLKPTQPPPLHTPLESDTPTARALSHVLSVVSRVPIASRKYELVRSLAERLLDDNLRCDGGAGGRLEEINSAALSAAFARALRCLEAAAYVPAGPVDRSVELIVAGVRRWWLTTAAADGEEVVEEASAEKLAAELLWLAQKMVDSGAAEEAVTRWGAASGLARLSLSAQPRLQGAFVRVSAFLFKQANAKKVEGGKGGKEEEEGTTTRNQLMMLISWLPLLCRASNGTDSPTLSSAERAETVKVLEETIEKLSGDQQEVVLALWLHHFTSCPDSDWPNLESCYTRWYAESRKLLK